MPLRIHVRAALPVWTFAVLSGCATTGTPGGEFGREPFAPQVQVIDTVASLGPLATEARRVGLGELVAWHGHPCDGLVAAAAGLAHGLPLLFDGGPVDRSDLCAATNRSACYGDVAAFLTGARHRYGSLAIDPELGDEWVVHRRSTGRTLRIRLRPGVKPAELPRLEAELRAADCPPELMARVAALQDEFSRRLLRTSPERLFEVEFVEAYPYPRGDPRPDTLKRGCPPGPRGGAQAGASAP